MDEDREQLRSALKKFAKTELLLLHEAAGILGLTEEYLARQIRGGQAKAFKAGSHWFMERKWVDDFRQKVRQGIAQEQKMCHVARRPAFVRHLPGKKRGGGLFDLKRLFR